MYDEIDDMRNIPEKPLIKDFENLYLPCVMFAPEMLGYSIYMSSTEESNSSKPGLYERFLGKLITIFPSMITHQHVGNEEEDKKF